MRLNPNAKPWLMLVLRSLLFLTFQALFALGYLWIGSPTAWDNSAAWWPMAIIFTNLISLGVLIRFYSQEGLNYWRIFRIDHSFIKRDLLYLAGFVLIAAPAGFLPNILSAQWLFGSPQAALDLLVRPLPAWASVVSFAAFPILQGIVELPVYLLYAMPRLEKQTGKPWLAVSLASIFLSAQHMFAPFLPDWRFITYRLIMFLPFAVLIAIVLRGRPRLFPYLAVIHILMDLSVAAMFLPIMT